MNEPVAKNTNVINAIQELENSIGDLSSAVNELEDRLSVVLSGDRSETIEQVAGPVSQKSKMSIILRTCGSDIKHLNTRISDLLNRLYI